MVLFSGMLFTFHLEASLLLWVGCESYSTQYQITHPSFLFLANPHIIHDLASFLLRFRLLNVID